MTGKELAGKYGFFTENTGGGCEALVKHYKKYDVVITVQDDPSIPDDPYNEPISIGVYTDFMGDREDEQEEQYESLVDFYQPCLNTFFQNGAGRIWEFLEDALGRKDDTAINDLFKEVLVAEANGRLKAVEKLRELYQSFKDENETAIEEGEPLSDGQWLDNFVESVKELLEYESRP